MIRSTFLPFRVDDDRDPAIDRTDRQEAVLEFCGASTAYEAGARRLGASATLAAHTTGMARRAGFEPPTLRFEARPHRYDEGPEAVDRPRRPGARSTDRFPLLPGTRDSERALIDGAVGFRTRGGSRAAGPRDGARSPSRASACACAGSATARAGRRPQHGPRSRRCPAR